MTLKQSIIVVNEYTIKTDTGKTGGSRGGSPGAYVTRYMARELATEPIAPVQRRDLDTFVTKYMARADAVESMLADHRAGTADIAGVRRTSGYDAPTLAGRRIQRSARRALEKVRSAVSVSDRAQVGPAELKSEFAAAQGDGGVACGHSGVSLSHESLHNDAKQIQDLFDRGHTVMKTVLSFDHDYLLSMGLIPSDMELDPETGAPRRGAYRGQLDQLKLRLAVMDGLTRMCRVGDFDDLKYVGVIQVDTSHVHVHLAMVDAGRGRRAKDGTQKGKLTAREMGLLRSGLDSSLDRHRKVEHLSSAVGYQRRSVSAFMRRWAYEALSVSARAQFILACLPEDRGLWRASSNTKAMAKANRLVRELVEERLGQPESPMQDAVAQVHEYATARTAKEGLSKAQQDRLVAEGRERIVLQAMNGVYSVLSAVADDELSVQTPMMSSMSEDLGQLIEHVSAEELGATAAGRKGEMSAGHFALRLRAYTERLDRHRTLREQMLLKARSWEDAAAIGRTAPGSEVMHRFYLTEADYHGRCVSKYQHYLDMGGARFSEWSGQWQAVEEYGRKLTGLRALRADKSIPKMKDVNAAERVGLELYGQGGGGRLAQTGAEGRAGRAVIDGRLEMMARRYSTMVDDLVESWRKSGAAVRVTTVEPGTETVPGQLLLPGGRSAGPALDIHEPGAHVVVSALPEYPFKLVKGVDMHELGLDWDKDQKVGPRTATRFAEVARSRSDAVDAAQAWMVATDQGNQVASELGAALSDIASMRERAGLVHSTGRLPSLLAAAADKARKIRLRIKAELEAITQAEAGAAARDSELETLADAQVRRDLEAELAEQARGRSPKRKGATTRLDTGLGGAINASMDAAVLEYRVDRGDEGRGPASPRG
ncbi:relaxase MobL [Rhodococcus sp. NCIMB 12038]|uniref:relaxase MobL n=1 Tax=Rhodococcus sp. NCIMB 12038 TaxID=933800 RepID=UPI000B3D0718|nr:relaxase MobL [Rhodococcus sp. NCIMB 12038]